MTELTKSKEMLTVNGIVVHVVRKDIKNLHLAVYPPDGRVRVAVPKHITDDNVRLAVVSKLHWIKNQQKDFQQQARQTERQYVSGECHYHFGKRCRLVLVERVGRHGVELKQSGRLTLYVNPGTTVANRERLLDEWRRSELKRHAAELLGKWQPIIGQQVAHCGIKKMRTRWGSCNSEKRNIWLNLELSKKPLECLEYILVHEMVHFLERGHNDNFRYYMDRYMPNWRSAKARLNQLPLKHENWNY